MSALNRATVILLGMLAAACTRHQRVPVVLVNGGNAERGAALIRTYGCGSCHTIPGIRGANAYVGPNLDGIASRSFIAGVLSNDPENMVRWLKNPPAIDPKTAMPNLLVTERDARDIAQYLYTLKAPGE